MPDTHEVPAETGSDYDPHVRDEIARLLDELRATNDPALKEQLCNALDELISTATELCRNSNGTVYRVQCGITSFCVALNAG